MVSLVRVVTAVTASILVWALTRFLSADATAATAIACFVLIFGLFSTVRTYLFRHRFLRGDVLSQYVRPALASVIVSIIVRMTHF